MRVLRAPVLAALALAVFGNRAHAGEAYYVVVFGSQRPINDRAKYAHSFASFVRLTWPDNCPGAPRAEAFTISWLPVAGAVQTARLLPEPGRNFGLHETIRLVQAEGERVSMWGPFQVRRELYLRALQQFAHLQSGAARYKAVDSGWPSRRVSNCIHALSDMVEEAPLRIASPGWGEPASYLVTLLFGRWMVQPCQTHDWVIGALGLQDACLIRRDLRDGNPAASAVLRALQAGRERRLARKLPN